MRKARYNIYSKVHKNLRTRLLDTGLKIQTTDFSKPENAKRTLINLKEAIGSFEIHLKEDAFIFHSIASAAPYIIAMFEKENTKNRQMSVAITKKTERFELLRTRTERINFGTDLQAVFFEFTASVLHNMNKEETIINELLWTNYTDNELAEMEEEIVKRLAPATAGFRAMEELNSMTNIEIIKWISQLFETATPLIAGKLMRMARSIIPPERWDLISNHFSSKAAA